MEITTQLETCLVDMEVLLLAIKCMVMVLIQGLYTPSLIVGGPNFTRRPAINNSIYGRESRGIGPFLPRAPPAQTPIGSLMPKALSPYNLSPHGSQGLGSMTGVRL